VQTTGSTLRDGGKGVAGCGRAHRYLEPRRHACRAAERTSSDTVRGGADVGVVGSVRRRNSSASVNRPVEIALPVLSRTSQKQSTRWRAARRPSSRLWAGPGSPVQYGKLVGTQTKNGRTFPTEQSGPRKPPPLSEGRGVWACTEPMQKTRCRHLPGI
jgi:hypothetical protein